MNDRAKEHASLKDQNDDTVIRKCHCALYRACDPDKFYIRMYSCPGCRQCKLGHFLDCINSWMCGPWLTIQVTESKTHARKRKLANGTISNPVVDWIVTMLSQNTLVERCANCMRKKGGKGKFEYKSKAKDHLKKHPDCKETGMFLSNGNSFNVRYYIFPRRAISIVDHEIHSPNSASGDGAGGPRQRQLTRACTVRAMLELISQAGLPPRVTGYKRCDGEEANLNPYKISLSELRIQLSCIPLNAE